MEIVRAACAFSLALFMLGCGGMTPFSSRAEAIPEPQKRHFSDCLRHAETRGAFWVESRWEYCGDGKGSAPDVYVFREYDKPMALTMAMSGMNGDPRGANGRAIVTHDKNRVMGGKSVEYMRVTLTYEGKPLKDLFGARIGDDRFALCTVRLDRDLDAAPAQKACPEVLEGIIEAL